MFTLQQQPAAGHDAWITLGSYILKRRTALHLDQRDIPNAGGPSPTWIRETELGRGHPSRPATLAKLETALQWKPGSVEEIWAGREPIELDHPEPVGDAQKRTTAALDMATSQVLPLDPNVLARWLIYCHAHETTPTDTLNGWLSGTASQ